MEAIGSKVDVPLVLHGASGIPNADLQRAIQLGHAKINFNTEINILGQTNCTNTDYTNS